MSGDAGVVVFEYYGWAMRYPELAQAVPMGIAQAYFAEATLYLDNTPCSPVQDLAQRTVLLGMLTAHIAALNMQGSSPLVGRMNSASEGSVSVGTEIEIPNTAGWFAQTKYGLSYWQAMAGFRMARYYPGRRLYPGVTPGRRFW